jgi:hypothetical protein
MRVETVIYQERKGGPAKRGLLINEGEGQFIGENGQPLEAGEVWDYTRENRWVLEFPDKVESWS